MKIAVSIDKNHHIFNHFGETKEFKIYDVVDNKVENISILSSGDAKCVALIELLKNNNVDVALVGHIGDRGMKTMHENNIRFIKDLEGNSDILVARFLADELKVSLEEQVKEEESKIVRCCCSH